MASRLIPEHEAHIFNFYLDGSIRQGLRHDQTLYGWVYRFSSHDRRAALRLASELEEMGHLVILTTSQHSYQIWIELRSSTYPYWDVMQNAAATTAQAA